MKKLTTILFALSLSMTLSAHIHHTSVEPDTPAYHVEDAVIMRELLQDKEYRQMLAYGEFSDTNPIQLKYCERILDICVKERVLDRKGRKYYKHLKHIHSVSLEMELIDECFNEDHFEQIQGMDEWIDYLDFVWQVRNL